MSRSCTNPVPANGGNFCPGAPIEAQSCNSSQLCPIDGNWVAWSNWSDCSGTCGTGTRSRTVDSKRMMQRNKINDFFCLASMCKSSASQWWSTMRRFSCWHSRLYDEYWVSCRWCLGRLVYVNETKFLSNRNKRKNWIILALTVSCFGICGTGVEIYTRNCTQPIAGGLICAGPTKDERACNLSRPCPSMNEV